MIPLLREFLYSFFFHMLILDITEICFHPHFPDLLSHLFTQPPKPSPPLDPWTSLGPVCPALAPGLLIKATDAIPDGIFHKSLILIVTHSRAEGTLGLIMNANVLPGMHGNIKMGGPVEMEGRFLLHTDSSHSDKVEIIPGLYFTKGVFKLAKGSQSQLFFGYSGWRRGQLEEEFERGAWTVEGYTTTKDAFKR